MGAPVPKGLKQARILSFALTVQTANAASPVSGNAAGAPDAWAIALIFVAAKPGTGGSNSGNVTISGTGIPDFPVAPGITGAIDIHEGYTVYLGGLSIAGANAGDSVCFLAVIPE